MRDFFCINAEGYCGFTHSWCFLILLISIPFENIYAETKTKPIVANQSMVFENDLIYNIDGLFGGSIFKKYSTVSQLKSAKQETTPANMLNFLFISFLYIKLNKIPTKIPIEYFKIQNELFPKK